MNSIIEILIITVIAVIGFTAIYKIYPFKIWGGNKPKFTLFSKYVATFNKPITEIESALGKIQFQKGRNGIYTRGKIYT